MTGAQLLNEVMKRYPATSRIILSGHADQDEVMRCVGATHQFLAKPCELSAVQAALSRIRNLRDRLGSEEVQKVIARKDSLPSVPAVYFQLVEALQNPACSTEQLGEIVATDPALTARVLQLVNSAFFGFAREVSSATEAVMLLGVGTIRSLALTTHVFSAFGNVRSEEWSVEKVWRHSVRVAQIAKQIIELEGGDVHLAEQAFTAGILHDVGKLILVDNLGATYLYLLTRAVKENRSLLELEQQSFGANHAEVGAYLLDLWGLPAALVEATALHHEPAKAPRLNFGALTAVHVADLFEKANESPDPKAVLEQIDSLYLDQLSLGSRLEVWRHKAVSAAA